MENFIVAQRSVGSRQPWYNIQPTLTREFSDSGSRMSQYTLIMVAVAIAFLVACLFLVGYRLVAGLASGLRPTAAPHASKGLPFECGNVPESVVRKRFNVKFYVIALLFVLFDVEIVFLYQLSPLMRELGSYGLVTLLSFLAVLALGYVYVLRKGAMEWT